VAIWPCRRRLACKLDALKISVWVRVFLGDRTVDLGHTLLMHTCLR
jgi:hypothetical protein